MFRYTTPAFIKVFYPSLIWELPAKGREVYLTFDDGPHPEITNWVLEQLNEAGAKATFFVVGQNALKYPAMISEITARGHRIGNHTMHHVSGWDASVFKYLREVSLCDAVVRSPLFRPPYGRISPLQIWAMRDKYKIIMWSILSRDYEADLNIEESLQALKENTEPGSIIVFHDSEKAWKNLKNLLPAYLRFCREEGFEMKKIGE